MSVETSALDQPITCLMHWTAGFRLCYILTAECLHGVVTVSNMRITRSTGIQFQETTSLRWRTLLAVCFLGALMTTSGVAGLTITDHRKSKYRIVVSASAIPSERYAAEELQRYIE